MNILQVNTRHFHGGGDSTYTFNLSDLLRARGHSVAFFAMSDPRNLPDPNGDLFVSHIDFRELNRRKDPRAALTVLARVIYSRDARRRFGLLADRVRPDLVHVQALQGHITPSILFEARKRGLPVVWTLHDYKLACPNTHFLIDATGEICESCGRGAYYQAMLRRCKKGSLLASAMATLEAYAHRLMRITALVDLFLSPSAFLRAKLVERGLLAHRIRHLPHFLPTELFDSEGEDRGYLLFLGKLESIKGIRPLLAASRLAPEVPLILAGRVEEPLATELPALLSTNARYVGLKHGEELRQLLGGARALVLPSLWYENQPFSILEAFACGKPVIASDLGGMTELIGDRERGLLVPPGDAAALAGAMAWMVQHPDHARLMGERARAYALERHSPGRHLAELSDAYAAAGVPGL